MSQEEAFDPIEEGAAIAEQFAVEEQPPRPSRPMTEEDDDDIPMGPESLAEFIGVSVATISNWFKKYSLPRIDGLRKVRLADALVLKEAYTAHGRKFAKHLPDGWGEPLIDEEQSEEEDDGVEETEPRLSLASRVIEKAKELRLDGDFETSSMLFEIVADHCDWSTVD